MMVPCIVCHGTKVSPVSGRGICQCCNGVGEISERRSKVLLRIQKDIAKRLQERGIEL